MLGNAVLDSPFACAKLKGETAEAGPGPSRRMSIIVTCPGCRKSFKVSDKFAGKTGPCPSCKRTLQVPTKAEEVQVHAPEAFAGGGKNAQGKLITKPIDRVDAKFHPVTTTLIVAAVVAVLVVAWVGGRAGLFNSEQMGVLNSIVFTAIGLLVVSPPLAFAAYEDPPRRRT